jgi:hypothetical protein
MNNYFSILFTRQHLFHPLTLCSEHGTSPQKISSLPCLKISKVIAAVVVSIFASLTAMQFNRLAAYGLGISAFYLATAFFKGQQQAKCKIAWNLAQSKSEKETTAHQTHQPYSLFLDHPTPTVEQISSQKERTPAVEKRKSVRHSVPLNEPNEEARHESPSIEKGKDLQEGEIHSFAEKRKSISHLSPVNEWKEEQVQCATSPAITAKKPKIENIVKEIIETERSFLEGAKQIDVIFNQIHVQNPKDELAEKYHKTLNCALVSFSSFYEKINQIGQDPNLHPEDKANRIAAIYCSNETNAYYQGLSDLTILYSEVETWGLDKYEKFVQDQKFPRAIIVEIEGKYSPVIFPQRAPRHGLLVTDLAKNMDNDSTMQAAQTQVKAKIEEINERKRRIEDENRRIDARKQLNTYLNSKEKDQYKAVEFFVKRQLYLDSTFNDLDAIIRNLYPSLFSQILPKLFKQIEELKLNKELAYWKKQSLLQELRQTLQAHLEYAIRSIPVNDFAPWKMIAEAVLAEEPVNASALESNLKQHPFMGKKGHKTFKGLFGLPSNHHGAHLKNVMQNLRTLQQG